MATTIPSNRARFRLAEVRDATGGDLVRGAEGLDLVGVCTDTRRIEPGCLYVALRGERHDGHAFLADALARGARAVLVSDARAVPAEASFVRVPDTLRALGALASAHRRRWGGRVVAITGSAGKTTTKELAYAALREAGCRVTRSAGNLNNLVGVPLSLLCLDAEVDVAVIELGTSAPGEIARLAEIARPEVGVVTSVSLAHTALLGSLAQVAVEKAALLRAIPTGGTAIHNADDAALRAELGAVRAAHLVGFGIGSDADVRLAERSLVPGPRSACAFSVRGMAAPLRVSLRLLGGGPALDAAAALAVVLAVAGAGALAAAGVGLEGVEPVEGRLAPREGPAGSLVLDDSYNANPASMRASIEAASELVRARSGRLACVLGDMLELGAHSEQAHAEIGVAAVEAGAEVLLTCGDAMIAAHAAARVAAHGRALELRHCAGHAELVAALEPLRARLTRGDVVLVKGSRGMTMERAVEMLVTGAEAGSEGAA